jgi:hypothetical protein
MRNWGMSRISMSINKGLSKKDTKRTTTTKRTKRMRRRSI